MQGWTTLARWGLGVVFSLHIDAMCVQIGRLLVVGSTESRDKGRFETLNDTKRLPNRIGYFVRQ